MEGSVRVSIMQDYKSVNGANEIAKLQNIHGDQSNFKNNGSNLQRPTSEFSSDFRLARFEFRPIITINHLKFKILQANMENPNSNNEVM